MFNHQFSAKINCLPATKIVTKIVETINKMKVLVWKTVQSLASKVSKFFKRPTIRQRSIIKSRWETKRISLHR